MDALGYVTYYYYDKVGRQYGVRDAAGAMVYYAYDALGRRTGLTDQRGNTSTFGYDAASRLISEYDPLNNHTYYQYDADGRLIARTDGNMQTAYFAYDAAGRQDRVSQYAGWRRSTSPTTLPAGARRCRTNGGRPTGRYDLLGRPIMRQDPRGTVVYYGYDATGRSTELGVLGQGTVYYVYNAVGRMTSVLDGKTDMETTYEYDPVGRVTRPGTIRTPRRPTSATTWPGV